MVIYFEYIKPEKEDESINTKYFRNFRKINLDIISKLEEERQKEYKEDSITIIEFDDYAEIYVDTDKSVRHESNFNEYDIFMGYIKTELRKLKLERLV